MLTLMSKVHPSVVKKVLKCDDQKTGSFWFFVDYSLNEVEPHATFDTIFDGVQKTLVPETVNVRLEKVFDQFGHELNAIPKGFQTICCFSFHNGMPSTIAKLPLTKTWEYNPNSISIAMHQSIRIAEPDLIAKTMNGLFISHLSNEFNDNKRSFSKPKLRLFLKNRYGMKDKKDVDLLFNRWKILGLVNENKDKELEILNEL